MALKFQEVLAGIRVRRWKVERDAAVNLRTVVRKKRCIQRAARYQRTRARPKDRFDDRRDSCAGNANDADASAARPGRYCNDWVSRHGVGHRSASLRSAQ